MKYISLLTLTILVMSLPAAAQPSLLDSSFVSTPPYGVFKWDWDVTRAVNSIDNPVFNTVSDMWSNSLLPVGVGVPASMLASANLQWFSRDVYANRYLAETGALALTAEAGTVVLVVAMKGMTSRVRPYLAHPSDIIGRVDEILSSFPSGHAAMSASMATMLSLRYPRWYVIAPAALWSVGISVSRMHLGVHYFTDVLAGTLVGGGMAALVYGLRKDIIPELEFVLPSLPPPDAAQKNAQIQAAASTTPLGVALSPDGGVSFNISMPIGR